MKTPRLPAISILAVALLATPATADTLDYAFVFQPGASGFTASISLNVGTSGTLIGNYDPANNPTGTRTKPGWFGPFGDTENVAVPTTLALGVGAQPQSSTTGSFHLAADVPNSTVWLDVLVADLLSAPIDASATATIEYDTFRTRNPTSLFPGGVPIELPLGTAQITSMTLTQQGGPVAGTLTPLKSSQYQFACLVPAVLSMTAEYLGTPLTIPDTPVIFPFGGQLTLAGDTALINAAQTFQYSDSSNPGTSLPAIPLDVPTILPPGNTASLVFNLTLDEISSSFDGTMTTVADGTLIPEPASLALLLAAATVVLRHRRR